MSLLGKSAAGWDGPLAPLGSTLDAVNAALCPNGPSGPGDPNYCITGPVATFYNSGDESLGSGNLLFVELGSVSNGAAFALAVAPSIATTSKCGSAGGGALLTLAYQVPSTPPSQQAVDGSDSGGSDC